MASRRASLLGGGAAAAAVQSAIAEDSHVRQFWLTQRTSDDDLEDSIFQGIVYVGVVIV